MILLIIALAIAQAGEKTGAHWPLKLYAEVLTQRAGASGTCAEAKKNKMFLFGLNGSFNTHFCPAVVFSSWSYFPISISDMLVHQTYQV